MTLRIEQPSTCASLKPTANRRKRTSGGKPRKFLQKEGYDLTDEYFDHESSRKGRRERKAFDRMYETVESREFDVLVYWSLDRFSREGIRKTISYLRNRIPLETKDEIGSRIREAPPLPALRSAFDERFRYYNQAGITTRSDGTPRSDIPPREHLGQTLDTLESKPQIAAVS